MSLIFQDVLQDLRYGARLLAKTPGLSAVLVLTPALGIGANTAIFSVLNAWLLRPLPVAHPNQIVVLGYAQPGQVLLCRPDRFSPANGWLVLRSVCLWDRHRRPQHRWQGLAGILLGL